jgi:hypothetical protein
MRQMIRWLATWSALGFGAGAVLMVGDAGHLPQWLLPPLVGGAGAAAGVLSWLMLMVVRRLIPDRPGQPATRSALLTATAAGAAAMVLLAAPLGIPQPLASVVGAVAGLLASFVSGSSGRSRNGR